MGQYYRFMNIDKKEICDRNKGLLKLTEHSYLNNEYCDDILTLLSNDWKGDTIIHVGDYAQGNDGTITCDLIDKLEKENDIRTVYDWANSFKEVKPKRVNSNIRYVYNLDKRQYIDLNEQPIQWCYCEDNKLTFAKFNSFALLIGCGNEQGGGDYYRINKNKIGYWAGDHLISSKEPIKEFSKFNKLSCIFNEWLNLNNRIKNRNKNNERTILNEEGILLKQFLKDDRDYYKMEIPKLKIVKDRLTDEEFKYLNSILSKYKRKYLGKDDELQNKEELISDKNEINSFDVAI